MKIAIHQTSPIAGRCSEILLAEADLTLLGVIDQTPKRANTVKVEDLSDWDVLVSDALDTDAIVDRAVKAGIPLVVRGAVTTHTGIPVFAHASLSAIARAIASTMTPSLVAATVTGTPLRTGTHVDFPPPVGRLRAEAGDGLLLAPTSGEWGGVVVRGASETVGIADQAAFLDAIALASAAVVMVGATEPGLVDVGTVAARYLEVAEGAGLEIARFRPAR